MSDQTDGGEADKPLPRFSSYQHQFNDDTIQVMYTRRGQHLYCGVGAFEDYDLEVPNLQPRSSLGVFREKKTWCGRYVSVDFYYR